MGTLSKRRIEEFGADVKDRIEGFRTNVGKKLDGVGSQAATLRREPANRWLLAAGISVIGSIGLKLLRKNESASFLASWVPTLVMVGLYTKLSEAARVAHPHHDRHDVH